MKCSHCGMDPGGKDTCSRCGWKIGLRPEIEVEYKDFKVSEYLEIRQKEQGALSGDVSAGVQVRRQEEARDTYGSVTTATSRKPPEQPSGGQLGKAIPKGEAPEPPSSKGRNPFPAVIVLLVLLAVLAGAVYLWGLLKP